jgi:ABC-type lipoprotein release transport system permease subunit
MVATGLGILVGIPVAWLVGRGLGRFLVGVQPLDPMTLVGAGALLLAGTAAALLPAAREAARTDPAKTLRSER